MAMVARSVGSWLLPPYGTSWESFVKSTTTELDYGVSHEDEKKSDDCLLSEALKAPHFDRRRNHVVPLPSGKQT